MQISEAIGSVIASDTQTTIQSVDMAVAQQSKMCADFAEACIESKVPMLPTQAVFDAMGKSLMGLIESRAHLATATRELTRIQSKSNLRVTNFGCPDGWVEFPKKAQLDQNVGKVD